MVEVIQSRLWTPQQVAVCLKNKLSLINAISFEHLLYVRYCGRAGCTWHCGFSPQGTCSLVGNQDLAISKHSELKQKGQSLPTTVCII